MTNITPEIKAYCKAVTKGMTTQHVIPHNGGWAVKKGGASKVSKTFDTQVEAVSHGATIAKNQGTELIIHKQDGKIKERRYS